ncbi:hypothetical protein [Pseudarthrobacter sp. NS4]|uniref:hypothetical protein n=1 Tax=Pseudarthrobacter sp. NS4 TaxID=2973976 RepID=UPI0021626EA4|nr:hypothetical protein [Pseudarthrobacter sp. NS4]
MPGPAEESSFIGRDRQDGEVPVGRQYGQQRPYVKFRTDNHAFLEGKGHPVFICSILIDEKSQSSALVLPEITVIQKIRGGLKNGIGVCFGHAGRSEL